MRSVSLVTGRAREQDAREAINNVVRRRCMIYILSVGGRGGYRGLKQRYGSRVPVSRCNKDYKNVL